MVLLTGFVIERERERERERVVSCLMLDSGRE